MNHRALIFCFAVITLLSGTAFSATIEENRWEIADDWYGYPVTTSTDYRGVLALISSDDCEFSPHFKTGQAHVGETVVSPSSKIDTTRNDVQSWFLKGESWILNDNLGDKALSNIVEYNGYLYVSVEKKNATSYLMEFDGHEWSAMNETEGWYVTDMIEFENILFVVKKGTNEILAYNGDAWEQPSWSNITGIINLAVFDDELYISTHDELYKVRHNNITAIDKPISKVAPVPMTVYDGKMYSAYRNQIYAYTGYNWTLIKVLEPFYYVSTMYPIGDALYVGTRSNPYENETKIFIIENGNIKDTTILGNIVYTIDNYNGVTYAGTNLGMFSLKTIIKQDETRIKYAIASCVILGLTCIIYALYTWDESCEDIMLISLGLAFFTLLSLLLASPSLYSSYVIFLPPIAVFILVTVTMNYAMDIRWDFRYQDKDARVVLAVFIILLIIEISTQVFSKAIGL